MTPLLTHDQASLLLRYGAAPVAWMLTDPGTGITYAKGSMACGGGAAAEWWFETTARGIHGSRRPGVPVPEDVVVPWRLIRACADALPGHLRAELRAAWERRQQEWARMLPPHVPSLPGGRAPWVAVPPDWHPRAQLAEQVALVACLDALRSDADGVLGQLDLFEVA